MRRRSWVAIGVAALAAGGVGVGVWWSLDADSGASRGARRALEPRRLDPIAFREMQAAKLRRARELAAQRRGDARRWEMQGKGVLSSIGTGMLDPQCWLGPHDVCVALEDRVHECDGGDADACMAIGQFLEATPPYLPMGGPTFFMQACRIGDADGCERFEQIKSMAPRPCRDDLLACAWRVTRIEDHALSEEACSLGIADGCLRMAWFTRDDAARSRSYIEASCQLGWPSSCADVARALKPGCIPTEHAPCWPPDPAASKIAAEMACAAGWGDEALCGVP